MSQSIPPGHSGQPEDNERQNAYAQGPAAPEAGDVGSNPYYAQQQAAPPPDLDAKAPSLKSSEVQRLNRKALVFLAGIVALLVIAVILMLKGTSSGKPQQAKVREETVVIPDLPAQMPEAPPPPIEVAPRIPPELPPLPQDDPEQARYAALAQQPRGPSLLERRISASNKDSDSYAGGTTSAGIPGMANTEGPAQAGAAVAASARFIQKPNALLVRGTYIRCILETRIITDVNGFTSCIVTEPVYSINGRNLLLPKGSKILGSYNSGLGGVRRVSVIWDRITTPNGIDVNMASPGVDNLGGAGHPGHYSAHWGSRISSALLISLISDAFKYAAAEHGPETTTITGSGLAVQSPYESATARTMERLANQALDRNMSRPPTVTINQGTLVNVYVAQDVDFSNVLALD
ncbi:TrbI/VirB10 family protein [Pseudoxanthomonas wuyuanensis]